MHEMRKIVLLPFTLLIITSLFAQQPRTISGKLVDSTLSPVARATVTLFYETPGDTLKTTSSQEGLFKFEAVKSRPFIIRTTHLGFKTYEKKFENEGLALQLPAIILTQQIYFHELQRFLQPCGSNRCY